MDSTARDTRDWKWRYGHENKVCQSCGFLMHVKYTRCPRCSATSLERKRLETRSGELLTYTIQYYLPEGFETPLSLGLVQLDNGLKVFCPLTDCNPTDIDVGIRGRIVLKREGDESKSPRYRMKFRPITGENR